MELPPESDWSKGEIEGSRQRSDSHQILMPPGARLENQAASFAVRFPLQNGTTPYWLGKDIMDRERLK